MDRGLSASEGSLYPLLARMREAGAVETRWEQPEDTGGTRPRRYYAITARGRELLAVFATVWGGIAGEVESLIAAAQPPGQVADHQPGTDTKETS